MQLWTCHKTTSKYLNLSYNALTTLTAKVREHFDRFQDLVLDLSGNNFLCNCQHLDFIKWIQRDKAITFVYPGDHVCSDSEGDTIHNIEVDSLHCNWYWVQPTVAVGCSLVLFLFFVLIFITYRKRWFIKNLIFRLQERFSRENDDIDVGPYKFDAFVLYSSIDADRLWVHFKLVPKLEDEYGFRLCIHHRNFLPGIEIVENVEAAIRSSRKVLVIMSENFVKSDWCVEEVHMTMSVDRNKFIVVMYSNLMSSAVRIPAVIRRLLETKTYIEWPVSDTSAVASSEERGVGNPSDSQNEFQDTSQENSSCLIPNGLRSSNCPPPNSVEDTTLNVQAEKLFWKRLNRALYTKNKAQRPLAPSANVV